MVNIETEVGSETSAAAARAAGRGRGAGALIVSSEWRMANKTSTNTRQLLKYSSYILIRYDMILQSYSTKKKTSSSTIFVQTYSIAMMFMYSKHFGGMSTSFLRCFKNAQKQIHEQVHSTFKEYLLVVKQSAVSYRFPCHRVDVCPEASPARRGGGGARRGPAGPRAAAPPGPGAAGAARRALAGALRAFAAAASAGLAFVAVGKKPQLDRYGSTITKVTTDNLSCEDIEAFAH